MKILVTGAGGFIGSHLTELLLREGHDVRALVLYNSRGQWEHLEEVEPRLRGRLEVTLGDVRDARFVRNAVKGVDAVLHLAALIGIPYSYHAPASYVDTNVTGSLNVLEACREEGVKRVVMTSTSEVYGTALYTPIDEKHPLQAQSPYAASKIAADKLAESYHKSFGLPVVTLRPFNTYGPRQSARAVIPTVLSQALSGAEVVRLGSLSPKRDLTFVEDTARAFLAALLTKGIEGKTIHVGQGSAVTVGEIAKLCLKAAGSRAKIASVAERKRPAASEVGLLLCGAAQAKKVLRWSPTVSLADGLARTAEYIRRHLDQYKTDRYAL